MSQRLRFRGIAAIVALVLIAGACGGGGGKKAKSGGTTATTAAAGGTGGTGSVAVNPLFVSTDSNGKSTGGTNPVTVRLASSSDQKLRVGFTEDEVAGTGDQWRAAGWGAVTVATLLTGAPLRDREVDFDVTGKIDGPSAGGLMTVAVLSLMRNEPIQPDITMTGTINPDGTIGPVGGIPYKIDGVVEAKKKRMLIPAGQRNSPDDSGDLVDVVEEGRKKGIEVAEVSDIYAAYKAFTGKELPRSPAATDVKLDEAAYQKLKAKVETWLSKFQTSAGEFQALDPDVQSQLESIANDADAAHKQAQKLTNGGLQAGAFDKAVEAAALANAAVKTGQSLQILLTQGVRPFVSKIKSSASIVGRINGLVDEFKTFKPASVSDAAALIAAYGEAVDAVTLSVFGQNQLDARASGSTQAVSQATLGAVFYEFAGTLVDAARDVLDVGRGLGGPNVGPNINTNEVAEFFRKSADANLNAFESLIVAPAADAANVSVGTAKTNFAGKDFDYALVQAGVGVIGSLQKYFGDASSSDYAGIGGAVALYSRTAGLLAKYYSLGDIDPESLEVQGIKNDEAFNAAITLAQSQLAGGIGVLRAKGVNPMIPVAFNEAAGVDREGTASDKLNALGQYWEGYLNTRVLTYLGGFAQV